MKNLGKLHFYYIFIDSLSKMLKMPNFDFEK